MKAYTDMVEQRYLIKTKLRELLKKTVAEISSLHDKNPLSKDEVQVVARVFTKILCESNAEHNEYDAIIRRWPNKKGVKT